MEVNKFQNCSRNVVSTILNIFLYTIDATFVYEKYTNPSNYCKYGETGRETGPASTFGHYSDYIINFFDAAFQE